MQSVPDEHSSLRAPQKIVVFALKPISLDPSTADNRKLASLLHILIAKYACLMLVLMIDPQTALLAWLAMAR